MDRATALTSPAGPRYLSAMRVLTVTHNYPRYEGDPAGAFVARIASGAAARGGHVLVLAPHAPGLPVLESAGGVAVRRVRYGPDRAEVVAYTGQLHRGGAARWLTGLMLPPFFLRMRAAVHRAIREFKPTVIHSHWWVPGGLISIQPDVPVLITVHGSDVELLERNRVARAVGERVLRRAAGISTASTFLARRLERLVPGLSARTRVTRMPVDVGRFANGATTPKAVPPRVLYAGNLLPSKGVDLLVHAMAALRDRGVSAQLRVLGQGPAEASLRELVRALHLEAQVEIRPFVPQQEMPAEYGAATVTALPTRGDAEGLGLTLVEAALARSAIVGSPAGGIPEVVQHEVTGLLFPDGDAAGLADALARLLSDTALRARLVDAAAVAVRQAYDPDRTLDLFLAWYDELGRRPPRD